MDIVKKEWVYSHYDTSWLQKELSEYQFDGRIDFALGPMFLYDEKNHIVVDYEDTGRKDVIKVLINDVIVDTNGPISSAKVERIKLSKSFDLQDFFDKHKNAKCIVFFPYNMTSVFHEAYTIRVFIDEVGYTPDDIENS